MTTETFVAKEAFSFDTQWQLCADQPFAEARPFLWAAVNDLPDPTAVRVVDGGYMLRAPWRIKQREWA